MELRAALERVRRFATTVARNTVENQVFFRSSSMAFTTMLSLVPLTMVIISFGGFNQLSMRVVEVIGRFLLPEHSESVLQMFVAFTDNAGKLGTIGSILFLLAAVSLLNAVEKHLNTIFRARPMRLSIRRAASYIASLVLISFLFAAGFGPLSGMLDTWNRVAAPGQRIFGMIISVLGAMAGMMLIFGLVSSARVRFRSSLIGSFIGALTFQAAKYGFTLWTSNSVRHSVIYGSVVFLPLLLIWLNVAWIIILVAAEFTQAHQSRAGLFPRPKPDTPADETELGWNLYKEIVKDFRQGKKPSSAKKLAFRLRADEYRIQRLLLRLEKNELIRPVEAKIRGYLPAKPPADQEAADVFSAIVGCRMESVSPYSAGLRKGFGRKKISSLIADEAVDPRA